MRRITVYTPTYNRGFCIHQVYESLLKQNSYTEFTWLIIDDGSKDNTKQIVTSFINQNIIDIKYVYQDNKGMLGAHNTAHSLLETELAICIDSDDYLTDNAIESIIQNWEKFKNQDLIGGIVGLDCYKDGKIIGDTFPKNFELLKYNDITKIKGDKKYIFRSSVLKEFGPYPFIEGEKFPAQGYLYRKIDSKYNLVVMNEVICVVEYLADGNSFNKLSSYLKNPKGFMIHRTLMMEIGENLLVKLRNAIHYNAECIVSKQFNKMFLNKYYYLTIPTIPFGIGLYLYLIRKKEGAVNKKLNK